ncbi:hypothetical protein B5M09_011333 [Aphanomyces astaci]|uniref:Uncharacterized protein n=2 Tax=Aphanomyces astaci TaxID=112090 RepID=A0A425CTY1_APHAT|nr:hypothetical protein B5M09_011333 [Aphanomyces astaci]
MSYENGLKNCLNQSNHRAIGAMSSKKHRDENYGFKRSSGVDYTQVKDRVIDDDRFERQRAIRAGQMDHPPVSAEAALVGAKSATMDAFVRMLTGQEEKMSMADKLAGPSNRPTWEEFKKENGDKLALSASSQEKEMLEYRRQLDLEREKVLKKRSKKGKKRRKHGHSSDDDDDASSSENDKHKKKKHKKKHKSSKSSKKRSTSPMRLSSFFEETS